MTFGDSAAYWASEPLPMRDSCSPGMVLIVNGSEPAKHRLHPHSRARHGSWRACASDALQAARVASEAGTTCSRAPHSSNACARNLRRGLRLRHCSHAASKATQVHQQRAHPMRAHIVRTPRAGGSAQPHTGPGSAASHSPAYWNRSRLLLQQQQQPAAASFSQASGAARRAEIAWFCRS